MIQISSHAMERYRERIAPGADRSVILNHVLESRTLGKKSRRKHKAKPWLEKDYRGKKCRYLVHNDGSLFVLVGVGLGKFIVVTCWKGETP